MNREEGPLTSIIGNAIKTDYGFGCPTKITVNDWLYRMLLSEASKETGMKRTRILKLRGIPLEVDDSFPLAGGAIFHYSVPAQKWGTSITRSPPKKRQAPYNFVEEFARVCRVFSRMIPAAKKDPRYLGAGVCSFCGKRILATDKNVGHFGTASTKGAVFEAHKDCFFRNV